MIKQIKIKIGAFILFCLALHYNVLLSQTDKYKWMRVGSLRSYFNETGAEIEGGRPGRLTLCDGLAWPAEYGFEQSNVNGKAIWIGCKNFTDPVLQKVFAAKVIGRGHRDDVSWQTQIFPIEMKMVGRFAHPSVYVDNQGATDNDLYDKVDVIDPALKADRMIINRFHTSMGVTVTRKILAFSQQYHNNYFVYEFIFKNTGLIDNKGNKSSQTLQDCYFFFNYRYAFSGESVLGYEQGWGMWEDTWGRNTVNHVIGTDPNTSDFKFRALYAWYGQSSTRSLGPDWDWGLLNELANLDDEIPDESMAAAKYIGCITLHADKSVNDRTDNPKQPVTTNFRVGEGGKDGSDNDIMQSNVGQYNDVIMQQRYEYMASGHPAKTHAEQVGAVFATDWGSDLGGYSQAQAFGPYTLAPGDSIRIVVAEAVAGIDRQKNREVARNWLLYEKGAGTPALILPGGQTATDHHLYKKAWVKSCEDSLMQTFARILTAYQNDFNIPQPPPPPKVLIVKSGGDRIQLEWDKNAETYPNFDGYEVWRAVGIVDKPTASYQKIFECDKSSLVNSFADTTARRGTDNYYYVVSKDNGATNNVKPGVPLVSSKFYTMTNTPARLKRPAGDNLKEIRIVPNPFVIDKQKLSETKPRDQISFYELPPFCKISIYTERGDLVWQKDHDDGSGDDYWYSLTSSGQLVTSGIYIVFFEVTQDYVNKSKESIKKGTNTYRKLIIIR